MLSSVYPYREQLLKSISDKAFLKLKTGTCTYPTSVNLNFQLIMLNTFYFYFLQSLEYYLFCNRRGPNNYFACQQLKGFSNTLKPELTFLQTHESKYMQINNVANKERRNNTDITIEIYFLGKKKK